MVIFREIAPLSIDCFFSFSNTAILLVNELEMGLGSEEEAVGSGHDFVLNDFDVLNETDSETTDVVRLTLIAGTALGENTDWSNAVKLGILFFTAGVELGGKED